MTHRNDEIAIIGMACRVPGANGPDELWQMLLDGQEASRPIAPHKAVTAGTPEETLKSPGFVLRHHPVDDSYQGVDTSLFGLTAREATVMDPQHRMFSEVVWEALEDSGRTGEGEAVGVFAGTGTNTYLHLLMAEEGRQTPSDDSVLWLLNDADFLSTRLSYALDLRGPSVSVQTACSSSLVALHTACQALMNGDCDIAVAGGTALDLLSQRGYLYHSGGIGSADGQCRPFSADATGSARGSGAAAVILKPLQAAIRDGDDIIATVRGSAVNNDGRGKAGFTAPSVDGQAKVVRTAQRRAGLGPQDIDYVEAHGTGTSLGDPLEVRALESVFGTRAGAICRLGSIKANIGHLDAAAGIMGVIKAALIVRHRKLPPQVNFTRPCATLARSDVLAVNTVEEDLSRDGGDRVNVGVTSLGFGGTNAHVVISEAVPVEGVSRVRPSEESWVVLPVSAATEWSLREQCRVLAEFMVAKERSVAEVARTLRFGRRELPIRAAVVARTVRDAAQALSEVARGGQTAPAIRPETESSGSERVTAEEMARRWVTEPGYRLPGERGNYPLLRLPAYTFDRKRHWPLRLAAPSPKSDGTRVHRAHWFPSEGPPTGVIHPNSSVLLIDEPGKRAEAVASLFSERFDRVRTLAPSEADRDSSSVTEFESTTIIVLSGLDTQTSVTDGYIRFRRVIESVSRAGATRVLCVTANALLLPRDATDDVSPLLAQGVLNAFNAEHEDATATLLDVPRDLEHRTLARLCYEELGYSDPRSAWRGGRRWVPTYPEVKPGSFPQNRGALRWLITGGKGGIATALTDRILATRPHDTVVLAARGSRPGPVHGYEAVELSQGKRADSPLRWLEADVCDHKAVERTARTCEQVLGGVDVVLHTAGRARSTRLEDRGAHDIGYLLSPKVEGTDNVLRSFPRARVILFSSLTTIKPLAGVADYAAANVYLENTATRLQTEGDTGVLAIAWPTWQDTGMAQGLSHGLTPDIGLRVIIDHLKESGVLFVATPQEPMPSLRKETTPSERSGEISHDPRPVMREMWHEVLGTGMFGDSDNLIDSGADSFVMLRFLDLADQKLGPLLSLDDLFAHPTLAEQVALVEDRLAREVRT